MINYQVTRVKLTNTQLNKLKYVAKNKTGTILRRWRWILHELLHELFLTKWRTTKIRNIFANNMSTDIKLSKTHISKRFQPGGSFGSWLGNLENKVLTSTAIPLVRDNLPGLVSNLASNAINKLKKKDKWKRGSQ